MGKTGTDPAPPDQWTLIRGARQLLTLRGASGPRRGAAMANLNVIPDGAVLVRNGLIENLGTARRIENLAPARLAREIDAAGKVVMPAFADPDTALAAPASGGHATGTFEETDIHRMSRRRLEGQSAAIAADLARYGVLTAGAHTLLAPDLQNTLKALRLHQTMQSKPLRIRSIFSPPYWPGDHSSLDRQRVRETWLPAIAGKKLAALIEIPASTAQTGDSMALASAGAAAGFSIRLRLAGPATAEVLELAYSAGAVALVGVIPWESRISRALADTGCVHVALASQIQAGNCISARGAVDDGMPLALASGYLRSGSASLNPQFLLHMACQSLGLTIEEAIVAVTYNAVCSLRLSHVTGSLEPGKSADICVVDVDDYRELARRAGHHDAHLVMRAGKIVYRRPSLTTE